MPHSFLVPTTAVAGSATMIETGLVVGVLALVLALVWSRPTGSAVNASGKPPACGYYDPDAARYGHGFCGPPT